MGMNTLTFRWLSGLILVSTLGVNVRGETVPVDSELRTRQFIVMGYQGIATELTIGKGPYLRSLEELLQPAVFKRTGGWLNYLTNNIDGSIGAKYIKIPKGEKQASQSVMVRFMVNERGVVINAGVLNKNEVHSKLAEEALRVVTSSPPWTPAILYGEKIIYWQKQEITFQASK